MAKLPFRLSGNAMIAVLVAGVALIGFAGGFMAAPAAPLPDVAQATRNEWRDLAARPDQNARDLGVLASRRPWGTTAVDPAAAAAAAAAAGVQGGGVQGGGLQGVSNSIPWRVTGVARQGSRYLAMLTQSPPNQPIKSGFLQVGEQLPDGRSITAIDPDSIEVDGTSGRQRIRLYWPKT